MKNKIILFALFCVAYTCLCSVSANGQCLLSGSSTVCVSGGTSAITSSVSYAAEYWTTSDPSIATVSSSGLGTAIVTGGSTVGIVTITYVENDGSGTTCSMTMTVDPFPGVISGPTTVCSFAGGGAMNTILLTTSGDAGGTWTSSNTSVATIDPVSGLVTGVGIGLDVIVYSISTGCGSATATYSITVEGAVVPVITGGSSVCVLSTLTLTGNPGPGNWNSSNPLVASVVGGVVTGNAIGTTVISYRYHNTCGVYTATTVVTVDPYVAPITGPTAVCTSGPSITLNDVTTGGVWTSAGVHTSVAATSGVVIGISAGTETITYTKHTSCGPAQAFYIVTVDMPGANISGPNIVCMGSFITLVGVGPGGTWSSTNTAVATVDPLGNVTGISGGSAFIVYTITSNSCGGPYIASMHVNVIIPASPPGPISGPTSVCVNSIITLSDATTGGVWSSSDPTIANVVGTSGNIIGVSAGTATITYTIGLCASASAVYTITVNPLPNAGAITGAVTEMCFSASTLLSDSGDPGGIWSSSNTSIATVGSTGLVSGVSGGTVTIFYMVTNAFGCTASTSYAMTIDNNPNAGTISGSSTLCVGSTNPLSDVGGDSGGTWSSSNTSVASVDAGSGLETGVTAGTTLIYYSVANTCPTIATATFVTTVNPLPNTGAITGLTSVCVGSSITLSDATADPGIWYSTNTSIATIGSATGILTGVAAGVVTIDYTVTSIYGCGILSATANITVDPLPNGGAITGPSTVCPTAIITLTDPSGDPGGVWSSSNTSIATISGTGDVTGVIPGTSTIYYTVTSTYGCGTATASLVVTVSPYAYAGVLGGPTTVCTGSYITLSDPTGDVGGNWTTGTSAVALVDGVGDVLGITTGTATIYYTVIGCGVSTASVVVTVIDVPTVGAISGTSVVCAGLTTTLSDPTGGGVWTSLVTSVATIGSTTGIVTGVASGLTIISYTVTNTCGNTAVGYTVSVNPVPHAGSISGTSPLCAGSTTVLNDPFGDHGGTWSSSNTAVATVGSAGATTGLVAGTTTISYTVTSIYGCPSATATFALTVSPVPTVVPISGPTVACTGSTITLSDGTSGGVWTSSRTVIATIGSASGIVTGRAVGTATITYKVTSGGCSTYVTYSITVSLTPSAGSISGSSSVCVGSAITLSDGTSGGVWTSSNTTDATVGTSSGIVTGAAVGSTTISYTVTSGACSASAIHAVTINALPATGTISGTAVFCAGTTSRLSDGTAGGIWTSSNTTVATVGTSSGIVTGVFGGTATISYTVISGGCSASATYAITVNPLPVPGIISGPSFVCTGHTITLTDASSGGAWSSTNTTVATIGTSGIVSGLTSGTTTISYALTNSCGTSAATFTVTIGLTPSAGTITGPTSVCIAATITLSDGVTGGVWMSSNTTVATIGSASRIVIGVATGTTTITYSLSTTCGTVTTTYTITVHPLPNAGTVTGASSVCQGSNITLSDATTGGVWTSGNTAIATVGTSSGTVTGVAGGTCTISYAITNGCGTAYGIHAITVNLLPSAGTITGPSTVCISSTITLSDASAGGAWTSSHTAVATINTSTRVVSPVSAGTTTITYTVTNGCGTATATHTVAVETSLSLSISTSGFTTLAGPFGSIYQFCEDETTAQLVGSVPGGTWSVVDPYSTGYAAIDASTGLITPNTAYITPAMVYVEGAFLYTLSNSCGDDTAEFEVFIDADVLFPTLYPNTGALWLHGSTVYYQGTFQAAPYAPCGFAWCQSYSATFTGLGGSETNPTSGGDYNETEIVMPSPAGSTVTIHYNITNTCSATTGYNAVPVSATSN